MVRKTFAVDGNGKKQADVEGDKDSQSQTSETESKIHFKRFCIYCGPRIVRGQSDREAQMAIGSIVCPTCGLDPITARSIEDVVMLGFEECYRREVRKAAANG